MNTNTTNTTNNNNITNISLLRDLWAYVYSLLYTLAYRLTFG